jgi:hypothetical protein
MMGSSNVSNMSENGFDNSIEEKNHYQRTMLDVFDKKGKRDI